MTQETQIILAFIFKRSGKTQLTPAEIYLPLSLDLGWFTTTQAQHLITYALQQKLLTQTNNHLQPTFDITTTNIPTGFHPTKKNIPTTTKETQKTPPPTTTTLLEELITHIATSTKKKEAQIKEELAKVQHQKNLTPEVAALFLAKKYNLTLTTFYDQVEHTLFPKENAK